MIVMDGKNKMLCSLKVLRFRMICNNLHKVKVKLMGIDPRTGKFKLSRKALMPRPEGGNTQDDNN